MGITIDKHMKNLLDMMDSMPDDACGDWRDSLAYAIDTMRKYQQLQADYKNRLTADMVAMLTDIQTEIEELDLKDSVSDYQKGADETREYIADLLQQKIDALKEQTDGKCK